MKSNPEWLSVEKQRTVILIAILVLVAGICWAEPTSNNRPLDWASPLQMGAMSNFYKVSDDLYRSTQPTSAEDLRNLGRSHLRIRTVVDLRWPKSNHDKIQGTGLRYEYIPMIGWPLLPKEEQAIRFLQIVTDKQKTPILVHCRHGADRTGAICAVYRIAVQGWSKEKAIEEMVEGGYGFHGTRDGNIAYWINGLNLDRIKEKAGIREKDLDKSVYGQHPQKNYLSRTIFIYSENTFNLFDVGLCPA